MILNTIKNKKLKKNKKKYIFKKLNFKIIFLTP